MNIPLLVFMSEIKIYLTPKKSNFRLLFCFKFSKIKFISNASAIMTEKQLLFWSFYIKFDASGVLTGYDTGCKQVCNSKIA